MNDSGGFISTPTSRARTMWFGLVLIALTAFGSAPSVAATLTVTNTADSGAGSLRAALAAAVNNDSIVFAPGVTGTITLASPLSVGRAVQITGPGASLLTISGNNAVRVMDVASAATVTIEGVTIAQGLGSGARAGLYTQGAAGGIGLLKGSLVLRNVVVRDNVQSCALAIAIPENVGGGIQVNGPLTLINSTVSGNRIVKCGKAYGAGIGVTSDKPSNVTLTNSTVSGNSIEMAGQGYGGGVSAFAAGLNVAGSTISGNAIQASIAAYGGGISSESNSPASITNSTISGNSVTVSGTSGPAFGAGMWTNYSLAPRSITVVNNAASGGNKQSGGLATLSGSPINSIIAFNSGGPDLADFSTGAAKTAISGTLVGNGSGVVIGPLADNGGSTKTHALLPGSTGIGTGVAADCSTAPVSAKDQRGRTRPAACSVGAYEPQLPFRLVATGGDNQSTAAGTPFGLPLTVTLYDAANTPVGNNLLFTFTPPASGAGTTAIAPATGTAAGTATTLPLAANATAGTYPVSAARTGLTPAAFTLTNLPVGASAGCGVMTLSPPALPDGTVGLSYAASFTSMDGTPPNSYSVTSGNVPPGLLLVGGTLDGKPLAAGQFNFAVRALGQGWDPGCGATINYTVTIAKGSQVLSFADAPGTIRPGDTFQSTVLTTGGLEPIAFTVDPAAQGVCSVDTAGIVTALNAGTCTLYANQEGDNNYLPAAQVAQSFTILVIPTVPALGWPGLVMLGLGLFLTGWWRRRPQG